MGRRSVVLACGLDLSGLQTAKLPTAECPVEYRRLPRDCLRPVFLGFANRRRGERIETQHVPPVAVQVDFDDPLEGFDTNTYIPCLRTDDLVFAFVQQLKKLPMLSDVSLQGQQPIKLEQGPAIRFDIKCKYVENNDFIERTASND